MLGLHLCGTASRPAVEEGALGHMRGAWPVPGDASTSSEGPGQPGPAPSVSSACPDHVTMSTLLPRASCGLSRPAAGFWPTLSAGDRPHLSEKRPALLPAVPSLVPPLPFQLPARGGHRPLLTSWCLFPWPPQKRFWQTPEAAAQLLSLEAARGSLASSFPSRLSCPPGFTPEQ